MSFGTDSITPDDNQTRESILDVLSIPSEQLAAGWGWVIDNHIPPARLFHLAEEVTELTDSDHRHIDECSTCKAAFDRYRGVILEPADVPEEDAPLDHSVQTTLWDNDGVLDSIYMDPPWSAPFEPVPCLLREYLRVESPILLPGNEVAAESWQFGRLVHIARQTADLGEQLTSLIVDRLRETLPCDVDKSNFMLVCFGRAMHRCGTVLAAQLTELGFACPHVILAHDYYSPTLICDRREFNDADVFVILDVVHRGLLLKRLKVLCESFSPRRVRGIALIDQSEGQSLPVGWNSLWREPRESRVPLCEFLATATDDERRMLQRFEPNEECGVLVEAEFYDLPLSADFVGHRRDGTSQGLHVEHSLKDSPCHECLPQSHRSVVDQELLSHIHSTRALKRDYPIAGKRYPFAVNVLDLVKKSDAAKEFVLCRAERQLSSLQQGADTVCLAYHAGRRSRAGVIAKLLGARMRWPTIPIGSLGHTFALTDKQKRGLASYDHVVIVDSAFRTGDTLSAMMRAIDDTLLRKHVDILAFGILNALTPSVRSNLTSELAIEIRTLFDVPLAPPTKEVRHWANAQKAEILKRMSHNNEFASVRDVLGSYCLPPKGGFDSSPQTLPMTRSLLEEATRTESSVNRIESACERRQPHVIRHLALEEVVQDHKVQQMLVGIMYNSMRPSYKESAAFALASASNYEWMNYVWLKNNVGFLAAPADCWKAIVLIECQMKLSDRKDELSRFRDAAVAYRKKVQASGDEREPKTVQLNLIDGKEECPVSKMEFASEHSRAKREVRLAKRLDVIIAAAE